MKALFSEGVSLTGHGGGKVPSVLNLLRGPERVSRLYLAVKQSFDGRITFRIAQINGMPGILRYVDGNLESATSVVADGRSILDIYVVRNPDKLKLIGRQALQTD